MHDDVQAYVRKLGENADQLAQHANVHAGNSVWQVIELAPLVMSDGHFQQNGRQENRDDINDGVHGRSRVKRRSVTYQVAVHNGAVHAMRVRVSGVY